MIILKFLSMCALYAFWFLYLGQFRQNLKNYSVLQHKQLNTLLSDRPGIAGMLHPLNWPVLFGEAAKVRGRDAWLVVFIEQRQWFYFVSVITFTFSITLWLI